MHQRILFTLLLLLPSFSIVARSNIYPTGAKAQGMGNAFVSQYDVLSVFSNQAGLANLDRTSIAFFYENRFLVKEYSVRAGVVSFTTGSGNFAVHYNAFGPALWSESNAGIAYSKHLTDRLSGGVELCYFGTLLPESNKLLMSYSFEFGAIYQLTDKTFLGAHAANLYSTTIKTMLYEEKIPWKIDLGGHTEFSDDFLLSYQLALEEGVVPQIKIGAQWEASDNFFIRGGVNTNPSRMFLGLGYHTSFFDIETAFSYHSILGYTPSVSIVFSFL